MPVSDGILFQGQYINAPGVNSGAPLVITVETSHLDFTITK